jgi:hypothetical protein
MSLLHRISTNSAEEFIVFMVHMKIHSWLSYKLESLKIGFVRQLLINASESNSNRITSTQFRIRGKVKVIIMVMGMCMEHKDKSVYRRMPIRLDYLSMWLKIGTGRHFNESLPYRISATSVKRFMSYIEKPMFICRLALLRIHNAENQNSLTAFHETLPC